MEGCSSISPTKRTKRGSQELWSAVSKFQVESPEPLDSRKRSRSILDLPSKEIMGRRQSIYTEETPLDSSQITSSESIFIAAEAALDFFDEISMLFNLVSDMLDASTSAEHARLLSLMEELEAKMTVEKNYPKTPNVAHNYASSVSETYKNLLQVYVYLYSSHYPTFILLGANEHLNSCCHRFYHYIKQYCILEESYTQPIISQIAQYTLN